MFDALQDKLNNSFRQLTNKGVISETNIIAALKDVKLSLLEADVNYRVVNILLKSIKQKALGTKVLKSVHPGQQFIKLVEDELTTLMGEKNETLNREQNGVTNLMLVGLQGSGKTTTSGKLAKFLKQKGYTPCLVSVDIYRPAAIEQLRVLAESIQCLHCPSDNQTAVIDIVKNAKEFALENKATHLLIDTAGRLQIDEKMMAELQSIDKVINFHEKLFVADAMTGQEAVNVAKAFNDKLDLTGFILTKMDGDARGGAALSIRAITKKPVKFIGIGEKIDMLEAFYPDRIASKILGMGDILSLVEKAQQNIDDNEAKRLEDEIMKNQFTLNSFQNQLQQISKMGSLKDLVKMIPGANKMPQNSSFDEKKMVRMNAILSSMTQEEKLNHHLLNASRKVRIAKGSGTKVNDINQLLKQFLQMKKMTGKMSKMNLKNMSMDKIQNAFGGKNNRNPFG